MTIVSCLLGTVMVSRAADVPRVTWDATSLIIDGRRVCPVMGEIHYSRLPQSEWRQEVRKMKQGGVTIIATYVFWNHIEEQQGVFRWDGQRSLRQFLEVCKAEEMPVVLRIGPFCHGEVRCGGIPDWMYNPSLTLPEGEGTSKPIRMRSEDARFLFFVERLYRQIFTQVQG
ncbi:MAG: beta-galactosidase, partial [Prevotella sp.]|nr:beta-galactosidase [Prevotella sp.]